MVYLIILTLLSIIVCYQVARSRGLRPGLWALMGLLFGPFAVPFVFLARPPPAGKVDR